jgi:hypothetical protein
LPAHRSPPTDNRAREKQQPTPSKTGLSSKRYATAKQLRLRYGDRSEAWLERLMARDENFPRPLQGLGRFRLWDLTAIEDYEQHLAATGNANFRRPRRG